MVECAINEQDRRKIDVSMTTAGHRAHGHYRTLRRATSLEFLAHLDRDDRDVFMRVFQSAQ